MSCCSVVEVSCLKMESNEFHSLRKTVNNKIKTFIFRVKVSCIMSVDGIILCLLIWLVNYFVTLLVVCQLSRDQSVDYCPKQDDHKATSLVTENKQNRSRSTNHKWQTMTFWTRASKYVFPKRSTKIIEGTEKPKICKMHSGIQQISL